VAVAPPATQAEPKRGVAGRSRLPCKNIYFGVAGRTTFLLFMYYTYILRSKKDGKLYVGWTDNLKRRFEQHNKGMVDSTRYRIPMELVYYEACLVQEKAIKREKYFKTGFGRRFLKDRV